MVNLSSSVRTVHAGVPTNVWREPADSLFFGKGRLSRLVVPSSGKVKGMIFFGLASLFFGGEEPTRNQWLIQVDNSMSLFGDFNIARYFSCSGAASSDASSAPPSPMGHAGQEQIVTANFKNARICNIYNIMLLCISPLEAESI